MVLKENQYAGKMKSDMEQKIIIILKNIYFYTKFSPKI